MEHSEMLRLVNAASAGKRPYFFENRDVDRLLAIVWAMAGELAVTRERLDTVERLLAQRRTLSQAEIEAFRPDAAAAAERGQWQVEFIARLLRVLQQEQDALRSAASSDVSAEDVSREVARE